VLLLLPAVTACMMWRPAELARIGPQDGPERVRVTRADSSRVVLEYPALRGDSITGTDESGAPAGVALQEVAALEGWEIDPGFFFVPAIVGFLLLLSHFPLDDRPSSGVATDGP
jgi:hypothetical protein